MPVAFAPFLIAGLCIFQVTWEDAPVSQRPDLVDFTDIYLAEDPPVQNVRSLTWKRLGRKCLCWRVVGRQYTPEGESMCVYQSCLVPMGESHEDEGGSGRSQIQAGQASRTCLPCASCLEPRLATAVHASVMESRGPNPQCPIPPACKTTFERLSKSEPAILAS